MSQVTVVGAGNVGATLAREILGTDLADVVLIDIEEGLAKGKALDLVEAGPAIGYTRTAIGAKSGEAMRGSDIVVITAGLARTPGMSREDLLAKNTKIVASIAKDVKTHASESIVIIVTNPLDAMCYVTLKVTGFDRHKVLGMAGVLDSARFRAFIGMELGISGKDVSAMVLGGHGDSMVPVVGSATVGGVPLTQLLPGDVIERLVERTRKAGGEIVSLLGKGSAFYGPGASAAQMVETILLDQKRLLPASIFAQGEYDIEGVFVGLPVILGRGGVDRVVDVELSKDEGAALRRSAEAVRETIAALEFD